MTMNWGQRENTSTHSPSPPAMKQLLCAQRAAIPRASRSHDASPAHHPSPPLLQTKEPISRKHKLRARMSLPATDERTWDKAAV